MTERRSVHAFWFGAFHRDGYARMFCGGVALLFLAFPLADLLGEGVSGAGDVAAAAGLGAFALLFLRLLWILPWAGGERRAESVALLAAIATLAVALSIARGDEWGGLVVYLGIAGALTLPTRIALAGVATAALAGLAIGGGFDSGSGLALQALLFGILVLGLRRLVELVEELEATRGKVAELAIGEERLRLSREMHDLLGHNLSVIALKSELARRLIDRDPAAAKREVGDVEAVARESLGEARAAVRGLRTASLAAELDRARAALETAGIEVVVRTAGPLPAEVEVPLAFAVREATTNVVRHSQAERCELVVQRNGDRAELEVRDDGIGPPEGTTDGSGLRGLGERMAEAGGTLDVGLAPGGGFRLIARVPLARPRASGDQDEAPTLLPAG